MFQFIKKLFGGKREPEHLRHGRLGEVAAKRHLKSAGLKFLVANFKAKDSEIDHVFRDDDCLVFVEVKARTKCGWTRPAAAVDQRMRSLLSKAAREYVRQLRDPNVKFRFGIVDVLLVDGEVNEVRHIPNVFPLTKAKRHA